MWEKIRVIFTIPELRQKILLHAVAAGIYRVGWQIPLPIVDQPAMTRYFSAEAGPGWARSVQQVAMFSASQLSQATIFGLGIMPYISASIIFQLLGSVYPPLEKLQKEGESGRKKINEYTRYATVVLCLGQSWFYVALSGRAADLVHAELSASTAARCRFSWQLVTVMTMTAGTVFLMWLGEQIDEYGIGNGISLLIMAGILARMPSAGYGPDQADHARAAWSWAAAAARWAWKRCWCWSCCSSAWWPAWCSSPRASGASPRKAPSTSAAGGSTAARGSTCRCGSTRPA